MFESLLQDLIVQQEERLMALGRRIVPTLTLEDILQPNDYPELEFHPLFRYEEGVVEGLRTALAALRAEERRLSDAPLCQS